jgi:hypothetical protein
MSIKGLGEPEIIRQLGVTESLYDDEVLNGTMLITVLLDTNPIDYSINLDLLNKACSYWVKNYTLLGSIIIRNKEFGMKYFSYLNKKNLFEFKNVEIIESNDEMKHKEIIEDELKKQLDIKDGPLWRLKVIKQNIKEKYKYSFIYTVHHGISDGKNCIIILNLIDIINKLMNNKEIIIQQVEIAKTVEELVKDHVIENNLSLSLDEKIIYDTQTRMPDIGDEINGKNANIDYLEIDKNKLLKLLIKSKSFGIKLTGTLETIICLAMKKTYIKHGLFELSKLKFQYYTLASVRDKLKIRNDQMGVYSVGLDTILDGDLSLENLWQIASKQSKSLHSRLANNEDLKSINEINSFVCYLNEHNKYDSNDYAFSHTLSNIGILDDKQNDDESFSIKLKAESFYFFMPVLEKRFCGLFFIGCSTINDQLCLAFSYNSKKYNKQFVLDLKTSIINIVNQLVD